MKLQNKKTGQVGNFIINKDHFECVDLDYMPEYRNLAELNAEWEDYEEPKFIRDYWFIDSCGGINKQEADILGANRREIGNYFETKEEAEKAVEKLKAWKRLKDKGIKIGKRLHSAYGGELYWDCPSGTGVSDKQIWQDLDLLFGDGE